jgi:hypothetical protein
MFAFPPSLLKKKATPLGGRDQTLPAAHTAHVFSPVYKLDSRTVQPKGARAKATEPSNKSWSATSCPRDDVEFARMSICL